MSIGETILAGIGILCVTVIILYYMSLRYDNKKK